MENLKKAKVTQRTPDDESHVISCKGQRESRAGGTEYLTYEMKKI